MMNKKDQMHPEDFRNLMIFAVLSLGLWFFWDNYITKPKMEALEKAKQAKKELILKSPELLEPINFLDREEALDKSRTLRLPFDNGRIYGTILLKGGRIDDVSLREYYQTLEKKKNVVVLAPDKTAHARYVEYGWVTKDKSLRLPSPSSIWKVRGNDKLTQKTPVTLVWENGQGLTFERLISIDDKYVINVSQRVYNNSQKEVSIYPFALVSQTSIPKDFTGMWIAYEGPIGFIGGELVKHSYQQMQKEHKSVKQVDSGWIGITDKYWLTAIIPEQGKDFKYRFLYTPDPVHKENSRYQTDFTGQAQAIPPGGKAENSFHLFSGAKIVSVLDSYERSLPAPNLDLAVDFGWFWFLTYPFYMALHYLGIIVGNMGVAIIILTVMLRIAVYPLTKKTFHSFAKMKVVSPRIVEIRDKYGDDKEKMQQEIVELYRKEGVNPLSGCLPMLVQIPIFFSLYKIIRITIELRQAPFFGWIQDLSVKDPTTVFNLFGLIPWQPPEMLMIGAWPCMMLIVMIMQKRLTPPPQDAIQRDMRNYFPFIITFVMAKFAAGLVIYWTFSALVSIIQQTIIMRSLGVPVHLFGKDEEEEKLEEKLKEGPDIHPLVEMAEEEVEEALFGDEDEVGAAALVADGADSTAGDDDKPVIKPPKAKKKKKKKK